MFTDKVAFITGGASGIGRALCAALAAEGAQVVVTDLDLAGAEAVAEQIGAMRCLQLDVTDEVGFVAAIEGVKRDFGRIDYIFNNAGIGITGEVRDMTLDHWRKTIDVNLWGVVVGTQTAYRIMAEQGFGHIVNIASVAGLVGLPFSTPYAATKGAVVKLSTSLRSEGRKLGVKVSAVCPGFIDTNIYESSTVVNAPADAISNIPIKLMSADKAAQAILRGVRRNKALIVFTAHGRLLWYLHRLQFELFEFVLRPAIYFFRSQRLR